MIKNRFERAFTLLEMLIVIAIFSILVGMGTVSYSTSQKKARDAKRKTDLRAIQNALEQYYSICGLTYPAPVSGRVPTSIVCASPSTTLMNPVPLDPKNGANYNMTQPDSTTSTYSICAPNTPPLESETVASYCLNNLQ